MKRRPSLQPSGSPRHLRLVVSAVLFAVLLSCFGPAVYTQDVTVRSKSGTLGNMRFAATNPALVPPRAEAWSNSPGKPLYTNTYPEIDLGRPRSEAPLRSRPLEESTPVARGVNSGHFLSVVGGIAFDAVARPDPSLNVESLALRYSPHRENGSRLLITLNGRSYPTYSLPDWQLVPIARYADSPYFSVVTLFGELEGSQARPARAKYIVSFHPSFESTLLGLRLFQADYMLLDPNATGELPKFDGRYLLGAGEVAPDRRTWRPAALTLNRIVSGGERFQAYVLREGEPPTFALASLPNRQRYFQLKGLLYYHFWKRGPEVTEHVSEGGRTVLYRSFQPVHMRNLSMVVASQARLLDKANPAVYRSATNTMVFSALFRYCKRHDPAMWSSFLDSLSQVPEDTIAAPTPVILWGS